MGGVQSGCWCYELPLHLLLDTRAMCRRGSRLCDWGAECIRGWGGQARACGARIMACHAGGPRPGGRARGTAWAARPLRAGSEVPSSPHCCKSPVCRAPPPLPCRSPGPEGFGTSPAKKGVDGGKAPELLDSLARITIGGISYHARHNCCLLVHPFAAFQSKLGLWTWLPTLWLCAVWQCTSQRITHIKLNGVIRLLGGRLVGPHRDRCPLWKALHRYDNCCCVLLCAEETLSVLENVNVRAWGVGRAHCFLWLLRPGASRMWPHTRSLGRRLSPLQAS